ncbi:hypothetical protein [Vreelandella sedimenti]|uniref:hypothetical protein n=1 Tax=Vreelandella sedimenti TaxID=2729618 RepID=UPI00257FF2C5|nr:hypothetical protein [Halomonas sp. UBA3173]|tara:strand:- start:162135 stop:163910 length:1776 start_codon:yes stop_codon:yes gene_type:complete
MDNCYGFICLVPFEENSTKFFGFSELLAGLALMVLAWTTADARYKFRINTAPLPLQGITFTVVGAVGILTLLTDLWRAEQWYVLEGVYVTSSVWQAILGSLFLTTFLTWAWFAFIRPPIYGKRNCKRYSKTLYRAILKGDPIELAIIADELTYSAESLIHYATNKDEYSSFKRIKKEKSSSLNTKPHQVTTVADDILLLIGDKRFCHAIVESSPVTALAFFEQIGDTEKYGVNIRIFGRNILNEALLNKNSFLYHETEVYESGLIGYHKPLSQAMFSNHKMVERIGTLLDPNPWSSDKWDSDQWKCYCRITLMTLTDYVENSFWDHSAVLYSAKMHIESATSDLYKINGVTSISWHDNTLSCLRVVVHFIKDAVKILDQRGVPEYLVLRIREEYRNETFYDYLAEMIYNVIHSASMVRSPVSQCWWIQHNSVWGEFFNLMKMNGEAAKIVRFKVRRLIYNEIFQMKEFPNFKGARILGFCLNVLGLTVKEQNIFHEGKALHKAVLSWTKKNYAWLHSYNPNVAEACLVEGFTYDAINRRIIKTYPAEGLRREPKYVYFYVDTPEGEDARKRVPSMSSILKLWASQVRSSTK